jgi:hypothetical protein
MSRSATPPSETDATTTNQQPVAFENRDSREDDMEAVMDSWMENLIDAIQDARASEQFHEFLEAAEAFHDYSSRNQMLIKLQKPDATRVAGYNTWQNEFDRHVKEGENAIWIWRPNTITTHKCPHCGNAPNYHDGNDDLECPLADSDPNDWDVDPEEDWERGEILCGFSPAPVFDVSQTKGEPLPELDTDARGDADNLLEPTVAAAERFGMDVELVPSNEWNRRGKGYCRTEEQQPEIAVQRRDDTATVGTLIHEIAHGELHRDVTLGRDEREKREVEAEAVAYVVGSHFGMETRSEFYLASWTNDEREILRERLERINDTASKIINAIEDLQ